MIRRHDKQRNISTLIDVFIKNHNPFRLTDKNLKPKPQPKRSYSVRMKIFFIKIEFKRVTKV